MNLGVKFRIYGGFAIVVALAVTLAGFAVWQLGLTQTEVARMGTIADNNARVLQLSQTFEVIQRTYLQYKAVADETQLKQANAAEQKALSLLSAARQAETNDERLKIFTALESGIAELKTRRVALANLMSEVAANHEELNKVGDTMSTVSNALVERVLSTSDDLSLTEMTNSLARSMLLIQVANWRFHATRVEEFFLRTSGWIPGGAQHYPSAGELRAPLQDAGLHVHIEPLRGRTPFNSYLIVARPRR